MESYVLCKGRCTQVGAHGLWSKSFSTMHPLVWVWMHHQGFSMIYPCERFHVSMMRWPEQSKLSKFDFYPALVAYIHRRLVSWTSMKMPRSHMVSHVPSLACTMDKADQALQFVAPQGTLVPTPFSGLLRRRRSWRSKVTMHFSGWMKPWLVGDLGVKDYELYECTGVPTAIWILLSHWVTAPGLTSPRFGLGATRSVHYLFATWWQGQR